MLEGHGREILDETLDTSRTVGWFTTAYPVRLESSSQLDESIKRIKEKLRNIPNKGIGFGALRSELTSFALPAIGFNYLGQFDSASGDWQVMDEESGQSIHSDNQSSRLMDINGMVAQGQLRFMVTSRLPLAEHQRFVETFKRTLIAVIDHCVARVESKALSYTPSDLNSVTLSTKLLDKLQARYDLEIV
jgi:non-ribosomal peptide synthase protein (TIGR01720 family)